ncbi:MAG: rhomboid family intramembrane serine protease [Sphingobacteriales bacterium]|nr:rhomboid family intramembrane serine protease [Sphingobacteriales bacterium]
MTEFRPGRFEILPMIIKNLLIINALVYFAIITFEGSHGGWITDTFALHSFQSSLFKPHQIITYQFMHGSFGHLFFNMFALWMFGSTLENYWGPKKFLTFYLLCGIGAALAHMGVLYYEGASLMNELAAFKTNPTLNNFISVYNQHNLQNYDPIPSFLREWQNNPGNSSYSQQAIEFFKQYTDLNFSTPTVGASGSVFGILAAFGYTFPNSLIYFYFFIPMKAKWFVLIYAAIELFSGIQNSAGDNVAHFAHLGGAVVGLLLVYIWNKKDRRNFY